MRHRTAVLTALTVGALTLAACSAAAASPPGHVQLATAPAKDAVITLDYAAPMTLVLSAPSFVTVRATVLDAAAGHASPARMVRPMKNLTELAAGNRPPSDRTRQSLQTMTARDTIYTAVNRGDLSDGTLAATLVSFMSTDELRYSINRDTAKNKARMRRLVQLTLLGEQARHETLLE
jgi:hypothetical protein